MEVSVVVEAAAVAAMVTEEILEEEAEAVGLEVAEEGERMADRAEVVTWATEVILVANLEEVGLAVAVEEVIQEEVDLVDGLVETVVPDSAEEARVEIVVESSAVEEKVVPRAEICKCRSS